MSQSCAPAKGSILDHLAISMAVICAIHCLVTPVLLVVLPILATTFWVSEDFHVWMLLFVIPTTTLAMFTGCRKHKDKAVVVLAAIGLSLLVTALLSERGLHQHAEESQLAQSTAPLASQEAESNVCQSCAAGFCAVTGNASDSATTQPTGLPWPPILNTLGGLFLVVGHTRNFLLCRKSQCAH